MVGECFSASEEAPTMTLSETLNDDADWQTIILFNGWVKLRDRSPRANMRMMGAQVFGLSLEAAADQKSRLSSPRSRFLKGVVGVIRKGFVG